MLKLDMPVFIKTAGLVTVMSLFLSCGNSDTPRDVYQRAQGQAKETFPGALLVNSEINHLDDVLTFERVIKLEVTDDSLIAQANDVEYLQNSWFVLDENQTQIYRFSDNGSFLGLVGRKGEGPGEYPILGQMTTHKGQLVVANGYHFLFYNADGTWSHSIPIFTKGLLMSSNIFMRDDRAYGTLTFPSSQTPPFGAISINAANEATPAFSFGKHMPVQFNANGTVREEIGRPSYSAFALVNDKVWVSPPLKEAIEIYNSEGLLIDEINQGLPGLSYDDFKGVKTKQEMQKIFRGSYVTYSILHISPYVITVSVHGKQKSRRTLFDENGNLLNSNVGYHGYRHFAGAHVSGGLLISAISLSSQTEQYLAYFSESSLEKLYESGFDMSNKDDDNPYLFVSRVKHVP